MYLYSFQGAHGFGPGAEQVTSFVPAPNQYDQLTFVDKPQSPAFSFGYDERITQQVNQLTSNCNYNIISEIEENLKKKKGPKYGKGSDQSKKANKNQMAQQYFEPEQKSKGPQFGFGYKFDLDEAKRIRDITTPGPGQYYPDEKLQTEEDLFRSSTGWTAFRSTYQKQNKPTTGFGVGEKNRSQSRKSPGPAEYRPRDHVCRPQVHGFKFTNKKQYDSYLQVDKSVPGPGQYSPKLSKDIKITNKPKGYTLGPKLQTCMINLNNKDTPPPNAYELRDITSPQSNIMIGTSTRKPLLEVGVGTPGPGAYQPLPIKRDPSYSQGNSKRQPLSHAEKNNVPGPGSYLVEKTSLNGPKYAMKGKGLKEISAFKFENPSPSHYNPSSTFTKLSSPAYGTNKNSRFFQLQDETPAPNKYQIKYNQELKGPTYSFGAKKCKPPNFSLYNKQLEPGSQTLFDFVCKGPGSYDIPSSIGVLPKYLKQDPSQIYREIGKYAQYIGFIKK